MGNKKQREFDRIMRLMEAQLNQARQPSQYEQMMSGELGKINSFLDSKDYRNLPTGVNIDLLSLADKKRMQEMMRGTGDNVARGAKNGQALQNQRELDDNLLAREWGGAYEEQVGNLRAQKMGLMDSLQGNHTNRMNTGMSGYSNLLQSSLQRPKGFNWLGLLQTGMQALPSILASV